jgi:probable HAF family extracellular repeat protein
LSLLVRRAGRAVGLASGVAMLAMVASASAASATAVKKTWIALGPGQATGMNDQGVIVGSAGGNGVFKAVMWKNGVETDLGSLKGLTDCGASAINNKGQIVGDCGNRTFTVDHAFLWFRGKMRDLGTLRGSTNSAATAINNNGDVTGNGIPPGGGNLHAVLWRKGHGIQDLGTLGTGYVQSIARGINSRGQIVGWSTQSSSFEQAFSWTNGKMTALKTSAGTQSEATGINDKGRVSGGLLGGGGLKPALWAGGSAIVLPTLGGDGAALAINRGGKLAGWVATSNGGSHAAIWSNRKLIDLGSVRGAPTVANALNNAGDVVGRIELSTHTEAVALLTAPGVGAGRRPGSGATGHVDTPRGR